MTSVSNTIDKKTAVIFGGSDGIGLGCAQQLAADGHRVIISSRNTEKLEAAKKSIDGEVHLIPCDLAEEKDIDQVFNQVNETWGGCDILINSNGGPPPGDLASISDDQWLNIFKSHALSVFRATRLALAKMEEQNWGRIITIGSVSVKQPIDNLDLSNFVRGGLAAVQKTLSKKLAPKNITVHLICPGSIMTNRSKKSIEARANLKNISFGDSLKLSEEKIPMQRLGKPEEIGHLVAFLCSDKAAYMTGNVIQVDGGLTTGII